MTLSESIKRQVEAATVSLTKKDGRGALVRGNLVITAAHCVDYSNDYPMCDDFYFEDIKTDTRAFRLAPYFVEACQDIALLGELDSQQPTFKRDVEAFETFYESTDALTLCTVEFELFKEFPIHVFTHEQKWITGKARQYSENAASLFVEFDEYIKGGTSGSPIVNDKGEVVAVVSLAGGTEDPDDFDETKELGDPSRFTEKGCCGPQPRPATALPVWAVRRMADSETD